MKETKYKKIIGGWCTEKVRHECLLAKMFVVKIYWEGEYGEKM